MVNRLYIAAFAFLIFLFLSCTKNSEEIRTDVKKNSVDSTKSTSQNLQTGIDVKYKCGDKTFTVKIFESRVVINITINSKEYKDYELKQTASGSGVRYSDGKLTYWSKGNRCIVEYDDKVILENCEEVAN